MRRQAALAVTLLFVTSFTGCFGVESDDSLSNQDDEKELLRINHIQMKGTHNSYHVEPLFPQLGNICILTKLLTCRPPNKE